MSNKILICSVNWIGDSVMSMPAIQKLKAADPDITISMLVKSKLASLWRLHSSIDEVIELEEGFSGTMAAVRALRQGGYSAAYVFPNSLRSAFIPYLAGITRRVGARGHQRAFLLTEIIEPPSEAGYEHQMWEYFNILGLEKESVTLSPSLRMEANIKKDILQRNGIAQNGRLIGIIPGAAYGPAKRWSAESFVEVGRRLSTDGAQVIVLGSKPESELCARVASDIGGGAVSLAGETSLVEFASMLGLCSLVICNDSGGMHLSVAMGAKVVAIFGITDHIKTGPIGSTCRVIRNDEVKGSRDIKRDSVEARDALDSITPDVVTSAAKELLEKG